MALSLYYNFYGGNCIPMVVGQSLPAISLPRPWLAFIRGRKHVMRGRASVALHAIPRFFDYVALPLLQLRINASLLSKCHPAAG
jgi:hypothetical protein